MFSPVTNLKISGHSTNSITLQFNIHTGNIGGYWLYKSLDNGTTYTKTAFQIDSTIKNNSGGIHTTSDGTYTYFSYILDTFDYGRNINFYITAVSTSWEESIPSNVVSSHTTPSIPTNLKTEFDNYVVNISWNAPSYDYFTNTAISNYAIYRGTFISVGKGTIDTTNTIINAMLTLGTRYLIIDKQKKSMWYGIVGSTNNTVQLNSTNQYFVADTSIDYTTTAESIEIFIYNNDAQILSYTMDLNYVDTTITKNVIYLYAVASIGYENNFSELIYSPVLTPDLLSIVPYLRYVGNSTNSSLNNQYWRILRDILIDKNYYNKSQFDIPYLSNETYNFKGYIGVANCNLDIFLNDSINLTVVTDAYGNFEFNIILSKGENLIQLQARDYKNISFSNFSTRYIIRTVNIYTFFTALGKEYIDIWTEMLLQQTDRDYYNGRYESVSNQLTPLLSIYKDITETDANFRNILVAIYNSYTYAGFKEGLNMFLNALKTYASEIDDYKIFYNNEFYDTVNADKFPVVSGHQLSSTGLVRDKYWYAITSVDAIGEETNPTIISCDSRWWPTSTGIFGGTEYKGYNVIQWDEASGVNLYNVYKFVGNAYTNINDFKYVTTAFGNIFVDTGNVFTTSKTPPPYNINNFNPPNNVRVLFNVNISNAFTVKRKRNWMTIFVYAKNDMDVLQFQQDRITKVCKDLIPPELGYDIYVVRDSGVKNISAVTPKSIPELILNLKGNPNSGMALDLTGAFTNFDTVAYGLLTYGSVFYDSHNYEYLTALYESKVYFNSDTVSNLTYTWDSFSPNLKIYYRTLQGYTPSQHKGYLTTNWILLHSGTGTTSYAIVPLMDVQFRFVFNAPVWNIDEYFVLASVI